MPYEGRGAEPLWSSSVRRAACARLSAAAVAQCGPNLPPIERWPLRARPRWPDSGRGGAPNEGRAPPPSAAGGRPRAQRLNKVPRKSAARHGKASAAL